MEDELRLLRQAHDEQSRHVLTERVVAADRIRVLELRVEELERRVKQLEGEVTDAAKKVLEEHELASRHVEAARAERDAAVRQLEEFQQTRTYRLVLLMHRVLSRGAGSSP
jgi:hypothetical protein